MATRVKGQRTVKVSDCDVLVIVVESGTAPNIVWQFGSPVEQAPMEKMSVEAPTMKPEAEAPAAEKPAEKKRGFGRKGKANNAPAAEKPQTSDKPKGKKNYGKDKPAPLCTAQRICEYKGKDKTEWKMFAIVSSGVVKKTDGKWAQGTRFIQLRYIDQEEGMIVGSTFPCQEGDWKERLRNVRPFDPAIDTCGCDLCLNG